MKITQVVAGNFAGGMEKHVVELANSLSQKGTDILVIADPSFAPYLDSPVKFIAFNFQRNRYNPSLLLSLLSILKRNPCDIIHCHGNKASIIVSMLKPLLKSKLFTTVHNFKHKTYFLKNFNQIITVSNAIRRNLPKNLPITTIYNGIKPVQLASAADLNALKKSLDLNPSEFIWVCVGRLVKAKGFDQVIRAMREVRGSLLILGEGPERDVLEILIDQLQLQDRVKLLGHKKDAWRYIQCADHMIIPSNKEGFSYVFAEAMLAKTPIISADVPVANEILPQKLIYPVGDDLALANLMRTVQSVPYDFSEIFQQCQELFTLEKMAKMTFEAYQAHTTLYELS